MRQRKRPKQLSIQLKWSEITSRPNALRTAPALITGSIVMFACFGCVQLRYEWLVTRHGQSRRGHVMWSGVGFAEWLGLIRRPEMGHLSSTDINHSANRWSQHRCCAAVNDMINHGRPIIDLPKREIWKLDRQRNHQSINLMAGP